MKKHSFLILLVLAVSCQQQSNNKAESKTDSVKNAVANSHNAKNSLDYIGTYKGILPCADCDGLDTEITINENSTFSIKTKYVGKGDKIFELKGNFDWNKSGNMIILREVKNGPNKYFVGENTLTQLDLSGKKITGNLASAYILSKQPAIASAIETTNENKQTTVNLNNHMEATTVIKKVNPAIGKFTLAETKWKLVMLNKKAITQKGKKRYFLKLNSKDGKFSANAGCNNIMGSYVMPSAFGLSFSNVAMTRMACPDMDLEIRFSTMLEKVDSYKLKDNILQLMKGKKEVLATFEPSR